MHAEHADHTELNDLSGRVIGCAFTVLNALGAGFLGKVYENALAVEVRAVASRLSSNAVLRYQVGDYFPELLVEDVLLVELKTVKALDDTHRMQGTNYLKAIGLQLCLLLNFGKPHLGIKRLVNGL